MDIIISDLLDSLQEVDLDIQPKIRVPEDRIEELTMKKLHKYEKKRGRGLSFVTKVLVAAIIIATLAIPVMAVGGFTLKDWLTEPEQEAVSEETRLNLVTGSESGSLIVYNYHLLLFAEDVTATGLTFACEEFCSGNPIGTLTTTDGYRMEKWDGTQFLPLDGEYGGTTQIQIEDDGSYRWEINWEDVYGTLDSGAYRLFKDFTFTPPEGKTEDLTASIWFRIFTEDMAPHMTRANAALEALLNQHSYHLTYTEYDTHNRDYDNCSTEVWKSGNQYLSETRYCLNDGTVLERQRGSMLRDGIGYILDWSGDSVTTDVCFWERADYLQNNLFTLWETPLTVSDARLGQVYVEDNSIFFYEYDNWIDETTLTEAQIAYKDKYHPTWNHDYVEVAYHFDETGKLAKISQTYMRTLDPATADPIADCTLEIHDTDPEEIAEIINMQDVSRPNVFSWEADKEGYAKLAEFDGFVNTKPISAITSAQKAISRAEAEAKPEENPRYRDGSIYNMKNVWYDPDPGIWKVRFYSSQADRFHTIVWMDDNGITLMKSYSSYEEFN